MGIFTGAGVADGILQWGERNERRRGEVARLFETYKQNNPYASATDYNQYLEQVVGPKDFFIRGSLPAEDIINKMGADNQEKKNRDEYSTQVDQAARNLAVSNQMETYITDNILNMTQPELQNSMTDILSNGNPDVDNKTRDSVASRIGDYNKRRDVAIRGLYDTEYTKSIARLKATNGEASLDSLTDNPLFDGFNKRELTEFQTNLQEKYNIEKNNILEERKRRQSTAIFNLRNQFGSDQMLQAQLAAGSEGFNKVRENIVMQLTAVNFGGQNSPQEIETIADSIVEDMQARRDFGQKQSNLEGRTNAYRQNLKQLEADSEFTSDFLQANLSDLSDLKQGVAKLALTDIDMTRGQASNLSNWIRNNSFESPQEGYKNWLNSLSETVRQQLNKVSNRDTYARERAANLYPDFETTSNLVQGFTEGMETQAINSAKRIGKEEGQLLSVNTVTVNNAKTNLRGIKSSLENGLIDIERQIMFKLKNPASWIKGSEPFTEEKAMELLSLYKTQTQKSISRIDSILNPEFKNATQQQNSGENYDRNPKSLKGAPRPTADDIEKAVGKALRAIDETTRNKMSNQQLYRFSQSIEDKMLDDWSKANPAVFSRFKGDRN